MERLDQALECDSDTAQPATAPAEAAAALAAALVFDKMIDLSEFMMAKLYVMSSANAIFRSICHCEHVR
jgi:hypothetical protein